MGNPDPVEFPVSMKTKLHVVVSDSLTSAIPHAQGVGLRKLDGSEQNEQHVVRALNSRLKVPTPKVKKIPIDLERMSGAYFTSQPRCFIYDSQFMEQPMYSCDKDDRDFVKLFNATHKFVKVTTEEVIKEFEAIESVVKDFITENPSLNQVLFLLGEEAPPYPVAKAILDHWHQKPKINGSVFRMEEYPPDHCGTRSDHLKAMQQKNKMRKAMNDVTYLRRLRSELKDVRQKRDDVERMYLRECQKKKENILFLRNTIRTIRKSNKPNFALMLEPELCKTEELEKEPKDRLLSAESIAPNVPKFLQWCQDQK